MNTVAIIPARFASTRFPGKPLARETGKYLIQHVHEKVRSARSIDDVIIATDDERILEAVHSFGGRAAMTRPDHPSGTDRIAEVARRLDADLIVNVQGDEPEIDPAHLDRLVDALADPADLSLATLACPFSRQADPTDPNAVKVVLDHQGRALFFSRALIPYPRASAGHPVAPEHWLLHIGVYAYRRETLLELAALPPTPLEQSERLEQLRALEHGYSIAVVLVEFAAIGIDTPADYAAFVARMNART
ncbi:MAG: 3-deoxy-manno-octulosonate cytidylyltransferase [Phycisphaerae bacterium]